MDILIQAKNVCTVKAPGPSRCPSILDSYSDHPECLYEDKALPVLSNQKMNAYLKEIGDICKINKILKFHLAGHTFATTITLSYGVPTDRF